MAEVIKEYRGTILIDFLEVQILISSTKKKNCETLSEILFF